MSIVSQFGKFFVTISYNIVFVYSSELFPTVLRGTGMGLCSVMAGLGTILAPVVARELVYQYLFFKVKIAIN